MFFTWNWFLLYFPTKQEIALSSADQFRTLYPDLRSSLLLVENFVSEMPVGGATALNDTIALMEYTLRQIERFEPYRVDQWAREVEGCMLRVRESLADYRAAAVERDPELIEVFAYFGMDRMIDHLAKTFWSREHVTSELLYWGFVLIFHLTVALLVRFTAPTPD